MPFGLPLPDLPWWQWGLLALGGGFLALFVSKYSEQNRLASFLAAAIAVAATLCGLLATFLWIKS